jgi:hypothetical protein
VAVVAGHFGKLSISRHSRSVWHCLEVLLAGFGLIRRVASAGKLRKEPRRFKLDSVGKPGRAVKDKGGVIFRSL